MVAAFPVVMVAAFLPQSAMTELKAVYPYADPLCTAVSADGTVGFVAEGAAISVVWLDGSCNDVQRTPLDGSIWAIEPYEDQNGSRLFIAGGTMGLFQLTCAGLSTCDPCSGPTILADLGEKVCIDVAVDGPNGWLYALFSAEGATELRKYDLATSIEVSSGLQPTSTGRGYAIAVDPTVEDSVYVAMGEGGFVRVTISGTSQTWEQGPILDDGIQITTCNTSGGQVDHPASVRDLSIAVVGSGGEQRRFLYAAADRAGVVEIDLDEAWEQGMTLWFDQLDLPCTEEGFEWGYRVSTVTDGEDQVLIAVGGNTLPGEFSDLGPSTSVGHWEYDLGTHPTGCGLGKPRLPRLYLYARQSSSPSLPSCVDSFVMQGEEDAAPWRSLTVRKDGSDYLAYAGRIDGLHVFDLGTDPFTSPTFLLDDSHVGKGAAHLDGVASSINPNVLYLGNDRLGGELVGMIQVTSSQMTPIDGTNGLCQSTSVPRLECDSAEPVPLGCNVQQPACVSFVEPPNPFMNGLLGEAHWEHNAREWFVAGTGSLARQVNCTPNPLVCADCDEIANPCQYTDAWCPQNNPSCTDKWIWDRPSPDQPGWLIVQMKTSPPQGGGPVTRESLRTRWWQLPSPDDASVGGPLGTTNFGRNYFSSANDMREESDLIHMFRSFTRQGYVLVDRSQLMDLALGVVCPATGRGQFLELEDVEEVALTTHFEIEEDAPHAGGAHTVRGSSFKIGSGTSEQYLLGIAAGYVTEESLDPDWAAKATRPMAVFYDVTYADPVGEIEPVLAGIALGDQDLGFAVAVRTMTVGQRTYAFVADFMGRVWTFDASPSAFANIDLPEDPNDTLPMLGVWPVPPRDFDGRVPNILDLEIDGNLLYVATTSRGVTILDATDPANLDEIDGSPIDTPGLAEGIVLRPEVPGGPVTTIVVGDTRGGMRLYGLPQ